MNREKLQQLKTYILQQPEGRFHYPDWLDTKTIDHLKVGPVDPNECGTTGCVAGWCCVLFQNELSSVERYHALVWDAAARILELNTTESSFLFTCNAVRANREDAIKRIDWLLAGEPIDQYPWHEESWYEKAKHYPTV